MPQLSNTLSTKRIRDANGYLTVAACPISSFGIFDYSAGQLGLPGDPNRVVKVYRSEATVSDMATIASFQNVPFTVDHAMLSGFDGDDDPGVVAPESKGVDGVLNGVRYDSPWMRGDIRVFSRKAQRALDSGKQDLSLGYSCDFINKPGKWNGQPYEVEQINMRGNHIALVTEGRVPGARVLDRKMMDGKNMFVLPVRIGNGKSNLSPERDVSTTRNQVMKTNKATDAVNPGIKQSVKGVKPSITGMHGDREGRDVSGISRALRAIEDGLRAFNARRSPAGRAAHAAGKKAADEKIARDRVDAWVNEREEAKPRNAADMARVLES